MIFLRQDRFRLLSRTRPNRTGPNPSADRPDPPSGTGPYPLSGTGLNTSAGPVPTPQYAGRSQPLSGLVPTPQRTGPNPSAGLVLTHQQSFKRDWSQPLSGTVSTRQRTSPKPSADWSQPLSETGPNSSSFGHILKSFDTHFSSFKHIFQVFGHIFHQVYPLIQGAIFRNIEGLGPVPLRSWDRSC